MLGELSFAPIGVVRSPFRDRVSAPRQGSASGGAVGRIELLPGMGFEHALADLEGWERLWVIFCFHLNEKGVWRPKVLPPRSTTKRGVFATRSPHRPNPIGLSVVELVAVRGLVLDVREIDMIDGTPVLDIKPYVPYADAFPTARSGWLEPATPPQRAEGRATDPNAGYLVEWSTLAKQHDEWLVREHGVDLAASVNAILSLGPQPHPYRRIRIDGDGFRLAVKDWRVRFRVEGRTITIEAICVGYRPAQLAALVTHEVAIQRAFAERFAPGAEPA
jgi:tRNA-Thr(GGU) m(6)t(6)A37 methyltransferase TsaA